MHEEYHKVPRPTVSTLTLLGIVRFVLSRNIWKQYLKFELKIDGDLP